MSQTGLILRPELSHDDACAECRRRQQELYRRNQENSDLREQLRQEKQKSAAVAHGVTNLRGIFDPLFQTLKMVYGEIDAMGVAETQATPRVSAAWEQWKQKLSGHPAKAIDALMVHGAMTQTQLRILIGCANGSIAGVVCTLNKAGLINKSGGKISLKEL